jgi:eukaryotic-like serine/threonine-protein kinase
MRADLQRFKRDTETGRAIASTSGTVPVAHESGPVAVAQRPPSGSTPATPSLLSGSAKSAALHVDGKKKTWMIAIPVAALVIALAMASLYLLRSRSLARLTDKDTVVLADFANSTGNPVFDDALKQALGVALNQSPFLNVLPGNKVGVTLQLMARPATTALTPEVTREVCQRAGSKAFIVGSIAALGNQFVLGLKALDCRSGDLLAQQQVTAPAKEKVLDGVGEAAAKTTRPTGRIIVHCAEV